MNCEGTRKSPPATAGGRPGRVVPVSFDGPSNALNRSSERSYNCESPSMHFLRLPSKCGGCGLPYFGSGRKLLRRDFRSRHIDRKDCFRPAIRKWQGWIKPELSRSSRHDSPAHRPAVARSSARYRKVRGGRLPSWVRPRRCTISDMAHGAFGGASPRPLRYSRSVALRTRQSAPGPGFPDRRQGCPLAHPASRTTGFPDNDRSAAVYTELLRRAQDMPWTSGWPRPRRHTTAPTWELPYTHNQRITSAACLAALAA